MLNSFIFHPLLLKLGTAGLEFCSSSNLGNCKKANHTDVGFPDLPYNMGFPVLCIQTVRPVYKAHRR